MPSSNEVVSKEVLRLSRRLGVEPPNVIFWQSGKAKYDHETKTIYLHDPAWAAMVDPACSGPCYWGGIVMHELAHYLNHIWNLGTGHSVDMYAIHMGLVLWNDMPLAESERHECNYRPLSYKRGKIEAGVLILEHEKGGWPLEIYTGG
jgi:hypothetical protein